MVLIFIVQATKLLYSLIHMIKINTLWKILSFFVLQLPESEQMLFNSAWRILSCEKIGVGFILQNVSLHDIMDELELVLKTLKEL